MAKDQRISAPKSDGFLWQTFLIFAASAFAPLQVFTANEEAPSLLTCLVVTLVVTAGGLGLRWVLVKFGLEPLGATYCVAVFIGLSMNAGAVLDLALPRWAVVIGIILVSTIVYRLRGLRIFQVMMTFGAFFLIAVPVIAELGEGGGEQTIELASDLSADQLESTPDVVVIVSDGYAATGVLDEFFGIDNSSFYADLAALGFEVDHEVVSNYPLTVLSVSSVLSLDYVTEEVAPSRNDAQVLYEVLGGNNRLAETLRDNGYQQTYVESGWLGTQCRSEVDTCVAGPWPDESVYDIASRSVLQGLPGLEVGQTFTRGSLHSMAWLDTELEGLLTNDRPDYVYVHILAPHPPLFLQPGCESEPRPELAGFTIGTPAATPEEMAMIEAGYANQVQCVNMALGKAAELAAENEAVMVMFGDHGSDLSGQFFAEGDEWDDAQRYERFRPLFAGIGPGCDFSDLGSLINVGRRILTCLGDNSMSDLPSRSFVTDGNGGMEETQVPASVGD